MNTQNNERYNVQIQPILFKKIRFFFIICLFTLIKVMVSPSITNAKTITLPVPLKVRAKSCQEKRLKLTWKRVKGASGYQIYQYRAKVKKFVKTVSVGKKVLSWKSRITSKKQTFKIRAYKKKGSKKTYSPFSYEVTAIPYKKMAKTVNAGRIKVSRSHVSLSSYEAKKVSAQIKPSRHARNNKAKVYDKTVRWSSTDPSIAKVDQKGNITAQGKTGTCKVYARAHNGDSDWLWVKVKAYARPKKFDGMDVMQEDMVKLLQAHGEDLKDIADFFQNNINMDSKELLTMLQFTLDPGRNFVVAEKNRYNTDYKKIEKKLYQVLNSFPGHMEIQITNYDLHFILESSHGGSYVELFFLFRDSSEINTGTEIEESTRYFETAPRWFYHYCPPQG